jgi:hypothetical protein
MTIRFEGQDLIRSFNIIKSRNRAMIDIIILIIGFCILLHVILIVNNNTFCFATVDKVFY